MMTTLLNYVWINDQAVDALSVRQMPTIPEIFLRNVYRHAVAHPDFQTQIWVDTALIGEERLRLLGESARRLPSVTFRDLRDVPFYARHSLFRLEDMRRKEVGVAARCSKEIWARADLARLLVLDHVFLDSAVDTAFYCDMDIVKPQYSEARTREILKTQGVVFAVDRRTEWFGIENQFLGLARSGLPFLRTALLPKTLENYVSGHSRNGWAAFVSCSSALALQTGCQLADICIGTYEMDRSRNRGSKRTFAASLASCFVKGKEGVTCRRSGASVSLPAAILRQVKTLLLSGLDV